MRSTTPSERAAAVALAGLVVLALAVHVVTRDGPGPGIISPTSIRADLPPLAGGLSAIAALLAVLRRVLTRRALRSRVQFELLPADTFDPSLDDGTGASSFEVEIPNRGWPRRAGGRWCPSRPC